MSAVPLLTPRAGSLRPRKCGWADPILPRDRRFAGGFLISTMIRFDRTQPVLPSGVVAEGKNLAGIKRDIHLELESRQSLKLGTLTYGKRLAQGGDPARVPACA